MGFHTLMLLACKWQTKSIRNDDVNVYKNEDLKSSAIGKKHKLAMDTKQCVTKDPQKIFVI